MDELWPRPRCDIYPHREGDVEFESIDIVHIAIAKGHVKVGHVSVVPTLPQRFSIKTDPWTFFIRTQSGHRVVIDDPQILKAIFATVDAAEVLRVDNVHHDTLTPLVPPVLIADLARADSRTVHDLLTSAILDDSSAWQLPNDTGEETDDENDMMHMMSKYEQMETDGPLASLFDKHANDTLRELIRCCR